MVPLGVSVHLITSTVIGAIFGLVISGFNKLRITGFAKGIGFGVATGLIAFIIIFLPIAMTVMPPKMMDLMKAMNSQMMVSGGNSKEAMMSGSSGSSSSGTMMMSTNKMPSSASGGMNEKSKMTGNSAMNEKSGMMSTTSGSEMNGQMAMMPDTAKTQSTTIGGALLGHVVYGAVLGSVVTVLLSKTRKAEAII